ncbi:hypothetical protein CRG98_007217 [Punica granatum]|uniref:BED-type domain-containing protein n=1 Tax=Punica granatum TaxID=22663 RepID=A0A2I0KV52_PUNGR|nr:hypothetical protein CRG98_007217 [Punica granatum]
MASGFDLVPITPQKTDPAWKHCQMFKNGDKVHLKCLYCAKLFKGGGIHRIKEHLAGHKGNASTCFRVPPDVRELMQQSLDGAATKRRRKQKIDEVISNIPQPSNDVDQFASQGDLSAEVELVPVHMDSLEPNQSLLVNREGGVNKNKVRRKRQRENNAIVEVLDVMPIKESPDGADVNNSSSSSKMTMDHVHTAVAQFLYDIGAPLNAVNSVYFQPMIDAIASVGPHVSGPSYHHLKGPSLKSILEEVKGDFSKYASACEKTGCSLMVEQWSTKTGETFLSFLIYCSEGTFFWKSVDATDYINSSENLVEVLRQVVEEVEEKVGVKNVLQVITNGGENFSVAGKRLMEMMPAMYWAPCATECIDLILKDIAELEWISSILEQAQSMTRFIYNNSAVLNFLRRYTFGKDVIEPGHSQFATNFMTLKRMVDHKHNLQSMVTSQEWMDCPYSKNPAGLEMLDYVSSQSFWASCILITNLTSPLLQLMRIVGGEKKAAMGYVHAAMYRAKEAIKKELMKREEYMIYWDIIDRRWDRHWHLPLHSAGFFLNPKFFYSVEGDIPVEIMSGTFDCIERFVSDFKVQDKIMKEINLYKSSSGDFGRKMAVRARDTLHPAEWWSTYGGGCPNLSRLAIRILSQTCSTVGCKNLWIPFDQIHETKNCLEQQRLSDLVFVQYNLRLRNRKNPQQYPLDPIAPETRRVVEDWVTGFDDCEIFTRAKYGEEENIGDTGQNQL